MSYMTILGKPVRRYNPLAYVRGGAPLSVARATQAKGFAQPGPRGVPLRPVVRPRIIPPRPGVPKAPIVDPLWTRANNQVMQFMNPMLARLASQRVAAEANARQVAPQHIAALQGQLQVGAGQMDASNNRGIVASSAVNDALANRLGNQGAAAQGDLSAKLAQIGAADPGAIAETYKGAANAGFATGSADLQQLIAERAAAGTYQAKLPGIAALQGNKDLQQALSEMRQSFGEQEQSLQDQALEKSFGLWDQLRGEEREGQQSRQEALQAQQELHAKQKMALMALAATAQTNQEKMSFQAQMKALDRQNALTMAGIRADTARYGVDTRAATQAAKPTAQPKLTGAANQKYITVNGKVVPNPNYVKPGSGNKSGTPAVQTRLKMNKATNDINKLIFNPATQQQRQWVTNLDTWNELAPKINALIVQAGIAPNSPEGIKLRKAAYTRLGIPTGKNGNPTDKKRATSLVP
jgi:hypothetical protein